MTLVTLDAEPPLMLSASSHTSSHHTFSIVQPPWSQCTPSVCALPIMTFFRMAPGSTRKTAPALPPSAWPEHCTFERS
uniref:Uncharacterized protein n=1 Tax=Globisporangium ultimum (strain ATCC 200006 / CBS 805.95 / DAOM BR144) TaxID=431595 RepID=K3X5E6_GLOUD